MCTRRNPKGHYWAGQTLLQAMIGRENLEATALLLKHKAHIAYPNDLDLAIFEFKNTQFKPDSIELTKLLLSHKDACDSLEEKLEEKPANNLLARVLTSAHLRPSDEQRNLAFDIARLLIEHGENLAALATNSTGKTTTIIKLAKRINPKFHQLLKQAPLIRNEFIAAKTRQAISKDALSSHSFPTEIANIVSEYAAYHPNDISCQDQKSKQNCVIS